MHVPTGLLAGLKDIVEIGTNDQDAELTSYLKSAGTTFALSTSRNLEAPANGDPLVSIVRRNHGGVIRVPDAREITSVSLGERRRGNGPWAATEDYDTVPWAIEDIWVWVKLEGDAASAPFVKVTGRFGLYPTWPDSITEPILTLAAHRWRGRGGEATGSWGMPDGGPRPSFTPMPPGYSIAVKKLRVPEAPVGYLDLE